MKLHITMLPCNNRKITDVISDYITVMGAAKMLPSGVLVDPAPPSMFLPLWGALKNTVIKGVVNGADLLGDKTANAVIKVFKPMLERKIKNYIEENGISATVTLDTIQKEDESMKITVNVDAIDYEKIIAKYLPDVLKTLKEKDPENFMWKIYDIVENDREKLVGAIVNSLTDDQMESIVAVLVKHFNKEICGAVSDYLTKQKIELQVSELTVE